MDINEYLKKIGKELGIKDTNELVDINKLMVAMKDTTVLLPQLYDVVEQTADGTVTLKITNKGFGVEVNANSAQMVLSVLYLIDSIVQRSEGAISKEFFIALLMNTNVGDKKNETKD